MARAIHLINWFWFGCIAVTLISWAAIHLPQQLAALIAVNLLLVIVWGLGWLLDDGILFITKLHPLHYYSALFLFVAVHLTGLALYLWIYHPH